MKTAIWPGLLLGVMATLVTASKAEATSIRFEFDCAITSATSCTAGFALGSITLIDSSNDVNPVDVYPGSVQGADLLAGLTNLDAPMFDLKDADGLLDSAFDTLPTGQRQLPGGATEENSTESIAAVPEPASLLLLGTGLLLVARAAIKRRARR